MTRELAPRWRLVVSGVLALLVIAGCSSSSPNKTGGSPSASYSPPISADDLHRIVRDLIRQDIPELAQTTDAKLDGLAVAACQALAAGSQDTAWLLLVKADTDQGLEARKVGALIALSVRGWCPDQQYKLPAP